MTGEQLSESDDSENTKELRRNELIGKLILSIVIISINLHQEQVKALSSHFQVGLNINQENVGHFLSKLNTYRVVFTFLGFASKEFSMLVLGLGDRFLTLGGLTIMSIERILMAYDMLIPDDLGFILYLYSNMDALVFGHVYSSIISLAPQHMTFIRLSNDMSCVVVTIIQTILDVIYKDQSLKIIQIQFIISVVLTVVSLFLWSYYIFFLEFKGYESNLSYGIKINILIDSFNEFCSNINSFISTLNESVETFLSFKKAEKSIRSFFRQLEGLLLELKELEEKNTTNKGLKTEAKKTVPKLSSIDKFDQKLYELIIDDADKREKMKTFIKEASQDFINNREKMEKLKVPSGIDNLLKKVLEEINNAHTGFRELETVFNTIEEVIEIMENERIRQDLKLDEVRVKFTLLLDELMEYIISKPKKSQGEVKERRDQIINIADAILAEIQNFNTLFEQMMNKIPQDKIKKIKKNDKISLVRKLQYEELQHGYFSLLVIMSSPIIMTLSTLLVFEFLYPHVIPYAVLDYDRAIVVNLIVVPFRVCGSLTVFLTEYFVSGFKSWTWQYELFWILIIPQVMAFLLSLMAIHTEVLIFRMIVGKIFLVMIMAVLLVLCNSIMESFSYMAVTNYVVNNRQSSGLIAVHTIIIEILRLIIKKTGVGYNEARIRYGLVPPDFVPTREIRNPILFWAIETFTRGDQSIVRDLNVDVRRYVNTE
ncbi:putative integral membrane protein [Theileria parva strain Muguga]|uniref:Uncharacterized protein n=1 Tax=Theileria parva TaxID=5875 RepID=Q4N1P7_THEPA|nr:putative integral membrane protein [Theileria parva strain Muguga]EAN32035.1 putative integral membrane protein [Theileria parva strain Muguga]|eukprot:XP_764318.1 hypothetical protein [Theileria parva strain Muguga]